MVKIATKGKAYHWQTALSELCNLVASGWTELAEPLSKDLVTLRQADFNINRVLRQPIWPHHLILPRAVASRSR
jgi:hypothetical protein